MTCMNSFARLGEPQQKLLKKAIETMKNAYALWGFGVGAAVLAEDGRIYEGCNVESRISGLGICAERCAVDHAVLHGNKTIKEIAVVIAKKNAENPRPCGACLQYIFDFSNGKANIITASAKNGKIMRYSVKVKKIKDMLPFPFKTSGK